MLGRDLPTTGATSPLFLGGGEHSLARKGLGESQFRRGAYTVVLFICTYFVGLYIALQENGLSMVLFCPRLQMCANCAHINIIAYEKKEIYLRNSANLSFLCQAQLSPLSPSPSPPPCTDEDNSFIRSAMDAWKIL